MSSYPRFYGQVRWVPRSAPAPEFGPNVERTVLVLQQAVYIAPDALEWRDVPTEEE